MSTPVWDRAVEAAAKARFEDTFSDPDDPKWDEIDAAERQEWLDVMRVALAAGLPLLLDDLDQRIREIAELYLYDGDSDQPVNDGYYRLLDLASSAELVSGFASEVRGE